ncbi:MAG: ATP-binding cassette domain-containing protein [Clostridiales bacterium]|nr:ATP-binding cassette domain-containing protein [Clostridiales bacterium]
MFELKKAIKYFDRQLVLNSIDLFLPRGSITAVLGSSGCGKTTLLRALAGLTKLDKGHLIQPKEVRCSFIFQENRLLPWRNALTNLTALGIDRDRALAELATVGLGEDIDKLPEELSGGMLRRLAIARALAYGGDVFFFDEPLQGLDINTSQIILPHIKSSLKGKTAFLITHDPQEALTLADRIIIAGGPPFYIIKDTPAASYPDSDALADAISTPW